jgi:hypothetical protein
MLVILVSLAANLCSLSRPPCTGSLVSDKIDFVFRARVSQAMHCTTCSVAPPFLHLSSFFFPFSSHIFYPLNNMPEAGLLAFLRFFAASVAKIAINLNNVTPSRSAIRILAPLLLRTSSTPIRYRLSPIAHERNPIPS